MRFILLLALTAITTSSCSSGQKPDGSGKPIRASEPNRSSPARKKTEEKQPDKDLADMERRDQERLKQEAAARKAEEDRQRKERDAEEAKRKEEEKKRAEVNEKARLREINLLPQQEMEVVLGMFNRLNAGTFKLNKLTGLEDVMLDKHLGLLMTPALRQQLIDSARRNKDYERILVSLGLKGGKKEEAALLRMSMLKIVEFHDIDLAVMELEKVGGLKNTGKLTDAHKSVIRRFPEIFVEP